jgi:cell division protein FtsQ
VNSRRGANRRVSDRATRIARFKAALWTVLSSAALIAGTAAAAGLAVWAGWKAERYVTTAPRFAIDDLAVSPGPGDHLDAKQLRAISGIALGENVFLADLRQARERIEQSPWVRSASVSRELPRRVRITVEQRRAVAYVELGGLYLLDETGQVFKRATWEDQLDLPTVTGLSRRDFIAGKPEVRRQIEVALGLILPRRGILLPWAPSELSEIHFDPDLGLTLELGPLPTEVNLGFQGSFQALADKLERLRRTRGELARRQLRATALYLDDSRQPDQVGVALAGPTP